MFLSGLTRNILMVPLGAAMAVAGLNLGEIVEKAAPLHITLSYLFMFPLIS